MEPDPIPDQPKRMLPHLNPKLQISSPIPRLGVVAAAHGNRRSDSRDHLIEPTGHLPPSQKLGVSKRLRYAAPGAHGAEIDRPVSSAAGMVERFCGSSADLASTFVARERAGPRLLGNPALPARIAGAQRMPQHFAERGLTLLLEDGPRKQAASELADEARFLSASRPAVRAAPGGHRDSTVRASRGVRAHNRRPSFA